MRNSQRIFGLTQIRKLLAEERGYVFLELVISLPLIILLLWPLNNMFVNTWQKCKFAVADFILQQEIESAMLRIAEDARLACYFKDHGDRRYEFYHYEVDSFNDFRFNVISSLNPDNRNNIKNLPLTDMQKAEISVTPVKNTYLSATHKESNRASSIYIMASGKIYRQTESFDLSSPITGDSILSNTIVTNFKCEPKFNKLMTIELEMMSAISGHTIKLQTEVYMRGWRPDE